MEKETRHWTTYNEIDPSFKHGENLKIGKYCVIEEDVIVGDDVEIGYFVLLKKGTRIGNNTYVDSYVRVFRRQFNRE